MLSVTAGMDGPAKSFNPRPALRPGDADVGTRRPNLALKFQSAPGLEAGRCPQRVSSTWLRRCFNPRPALRPGDAPEPQPDKPASGVSIRARP